MEDPDARPRGLDGSLLLEEAVRLAEEVNATASGAPAPGFELSHDWRLRALQTGPHAPSGRRAEV